MSQREPHSQLQSIDRRKLLLQGLFLIALTYLIYSPAFFGGLIFDDIGHLFQDRRIRSFAGLIKIWLHPTQDYQHQYYPLTSTTFWLMHQLWQFNTLGYHLVNIGFHACNALLLWRLLKLLHVPGSYWAAMFFAVCPVNVQSVAWIIELKNVQSCFFYLASAVMFVQMRQEREKVRWGLYVLAIVFFACALLSKAATSSLPAGLLLILLWKRQGTFKRDAALLIPFVIMGASFAVWVKGLEENFSGAGVDLGLSTADRWALFGQTLWFYARQLLLPIDLRFVYPKWEVNAAELLQWLPTAGVVIVIAILVKMIKRWGLGPLMGMLYFVIAIGPLAFVSVAYMRYSYVANHWVYWASMGFLTLFATAVFQMIPHHKARVVIMLALVLLMGGRSWSHTPVYQSPTRMWRHVLDAYPQLSLAHLNYANDIRKTDVDLGFKHYQFAMLYNPYDYRPRFGLGTLYLQQGNPQLCRFYTTQALLYNPYAQNVQYQNARCLIVLGQVDKGQNVLEKLLKRNPDHFESIVLLAHVYLIQNRVDDAAKLADHAVVIDPTDKQTLGVIGMIQARQGEFESAKENLLKAVSSNPKFFDGLLTLGVINHQQGNLGAAQMYYQRVLDNEPLSTPANEKLGLLLWEQGHWQQAMTHCLIPYRADASRVLAGRRAADAMGHLGQIDDALKLFREIYQQGNRSPQLLNELAWVLAIKADPKALMLARQTAEMTHHQVALVLDTLATAYAATGDFEQAVTWSQKALEIAKANGEKQLAAGIQMRLERFKQQRPWTDYPRTPN
ncbi:MAG: tetratricopeptide repeat protein [Phycisphaeraceae bacterium JB051]